MLRSSLTSIDAVTIGSAGPVAHFALVRAGFARGESVLVRGAAGSIGITAVQLASEGGASSIAVTTSSPERGSRLREIGATQVLDRSGDTDSAGSPAHDVIIDIVGGDGLPAFIDRLAPNGRMVVVGMVSGLPPADFGMRLISAFQQSRSVATFSLNTIGADAKTAVRAEQFDAVASGQLRTFVHDVLPLEQAAEAHRQMDAGHVFGRIVLVP